MMTSHCDPIFEPPPVVIPRPVAGGPLRATGFQLCAYPPLIRWREAAPSRVIGALFMHWRHVSEAVEYCLTCPESDRSGRGSTGQIFFCDAVAPRSGTPSTERRAGHVSKPRGCSCVTRYATPA